MNTKYSFENFIERNNLADKGLGWMKMLIWMWTVLLWDLRFSRRWGFMLRSPGCDTV